MQPCRRKSKEERKCPFGDYMRLLSYEKERSERHNRFFALCGLSFYDVPGDDLVGFLQNHLRISDYVFQVLNSDEPIQGSSKIGVLLPETDSQGAGVVKERMHHLCNARKFQVQMGLAIYPDDATVPGKILEKAFETALSESAIKVNAEVDR